MAEEHVDTGLEQVPPPGEAVHLPGPSYLPVVVAAGIAIALVGVLTSWVVCGVGAVIALIAIVRWVREAREEHASLPLEH